MSVPRLLLAPTHRSSAADAVAAAVRELLAAQGQEVRYHHVGPLGPAGAWDRWEGAAFLDPGLYDERTLLRLYEIATHDAGLSLLSSSIGLLDCPEGMAWTPLDLARLLDCPLVVLVDVEDWAQGVQILATGLKAHAQNVDLAGVILCGVADRGHFLLLREQLVRQELKVVGCLFKADGPGWRDVPPGAWGLPLAPSLLEAMSRQVDLRGLVTLAGRRGFLPSTGWPGQREGKGPLVAVAGGRGFTPWSRDSIEVLRGAGASIRRLDLLEDNDLPPGTSGLVLAGTMWPSYVSEIGMNTMLLGAIRRAVERGMPTLALGGGSALLLDKVRDSLGRTSDMAGVVEAEGEIVWEHTEPVYLRLTAVSDNLLLKKQEELTAWMLTEIETSGLTPEGEEAFAMAGSGELEGLCRDNLLSSRSLVHLASLPGMAERFVGRCAAFAQGE